MAGNTAILSVRVVGDAKDAQSALEATGRSAGKLSGLGAKIGAGFKAGVGVVAAGAVAGLGIALQKGFTRLTGIENAQAKMRGLGHDTAAVETIMGNALSSVKGTAYSLDEAATVAAGAVAAGIVPGQQLEGVLGTVANSAAAAGTSMDDMGSIFTKVASLGKAQNDSLQRVADRGIPIYQSLADQLGVTSDEVFKMASAGKIGFAEFESAMAAASGNVAAELGETTTGSIMNLNAALGRLGASLLEESLPHLRTGIQTLTGWIDALEPKLKPVADAIGKGLGVALEAVAGWLAGLDFSSFDGFLASAGPAFTSIGTAVAGAWPQLQAFISALPQLGASAGTLVSGGVQALGTVLGFLANNMGTVSAILPAIIAGFTALKIVQAANAAFGQGSALGMAAQVASNIALTASNRALVSSYAAVTAAQTTSTAATTANTAAKSAGILASIRAAAAAVAHRVAMIASAVATKAVAAAQWILNAAMSANPFALIVIAIAAFVAGIIWAYNNVGWFRDGVIAAWNFIKSASVAVWNFLKSLISVVWTGIVFYFQNLNPVGIIITHWSTIRAFTVNVFNSVKSFLVGVWSGIVSFVTATASRIVSGLSSAWQNARARTVNAFNALKAAAVAALRALLAGAVSAARSIVSGLSSAWQNARARTVNAWNALTASVRGGIGKAVGLVRSLPGKIRGALGNLGSLLRGSGRALIDGFVNGIKSAIGRVKSAASSVVKAARDFFPFSPAKTGPLAGRGYVTHSGEALVGDFAKAMRGELSAVRRATAQVASAAQLIGGYDLGGDLRRVIPAPAELTRAYAPSRQTPAEVHVHIDGAFVGSELALAKELERLLSQRAAIIGRA